jgi:hypothetical protein
MSYSLKINPIAPNYETCAECWVVLSTSIVSATKDDITKLSCIQSSNRRNYCWRLSSKKYIVSRDLREHIDWLISILTNAGFNADKFCDTEFTLKCFWHSKYGDGGPMLCTEQTSALAKLGLDCVFDIYYEKGQWNRKDQ